APLSQVICQLRFPQILRIESEVPADFQDRIRGTYPHVERTRNELADIPPEIAQAMGIAVAASTSFKFHTEDKKLTVGLEPESLSLTARTYTEWSDFLRKLTPALDALAEIYKPS